MNSLKNGLVQGKWCDRRSEQEFRFFLRRNKEIKDDLSIFLFISLQNCMQIAPQQTSRAKKWSRAHRVFVQGDLQKYFRLSDRIPDWKCSAYFPFNISVRKIPKFQEEKDSNPFIFSELQAEYPECCFFCWLMFDYQAWSRGRVGRWIWACEAGSCGGMCQNHDVWGKKYNLTLS